MNKGNKYLGRNSRRFSVGAFSLSTSDSSSNISSYTSRPRQTRTNSLSDNFPKFWMGFNPSSREESSVASDDTINNCDDICDTNDDEIETDEKENDRVTVAKPGILMQGITEGGDQEDGSVDGEKKMVSSLGVECDDHWEKDDENNNLVLRDISNAPGLDIFVIFIIIFLIY